MIGDKRRLRGSFVEFEQMICRSIGDEALPSVSPGDVDRQPVGCTSGGKSPHKIIAGKVTPAADDFLALRGKAGREHADLRAHAPCVGRLTAQTDGNARARRIVTAQQWGVVEAIDHDVEVAVVVEIGQSHSVGNPARMETPPRAGFLERQVTPVAESDVRRVETREALAQAKLLRGRHGPLLLRRFDFTGDVSVLGVTPMAGGDEQVFVSVEVNVEEHRTPRPVRGAEAAALGEFGVSAVAAAEEEHVARELRPIAGHDANLGEGHRVHHLDLPPPMFAAEHVGHKEIVLPVAIDVRKVHSH